MPLEIGQLIINARIVPDETGSNSRYTHETPNSEEREQVLIEKCVAEVLRILEDRMER